MRWRFALLIVLGTGCAANQLRITPSTVAPAATIAQTIVLVGDAGSAGPGDPVLTAIEAAVADRPDHSVVVYLGDNIYPRGMPAENHPDRARAENRLRAQLGPTFATGVATVFVPGNHDWDRSGAEGLAAIRRQGAFLEGIGGGERIALMPGGGCPGPEVADLGPVRLVALDTQWWLHPHARSDSASTCAVSDETAVIAAFRETLRVDEGRSVIVLGHHPLASSGPHGGYFPWQDHLFPLRRLAKWLWVPLPIVGSVYPLARRLGVNGQDLSAGSYRDLRSTLEDAMRDLPPLVYAAGHEHTLQVMTGAGAAYYLVSGAGPSGEVDATGWMDRTLYAQGQFGFMRLDVTPRGRVRLGVVAVTEQGAREVYSRWLDRP